MYFHTSLQTYIIKKRMSNAELDIFKKQANTKFREVTNYNNELSTCNAREFPRITTLIEFSLVESEEIINLLKSKKYKKSEIELLENGFNLKKNDYLKRREEAEKTLMFPSSGGYNNGDDAKLGKKAREYQQRNKDMLMDSENVVQDSNRLGESTLQQLKEQGLTLQEANEKVSFIFFFIHVVIIVLFYFKRNMYICVYRLNRFIVEYE